MKWGKLLIIIILLILIGVFIMAGITHKAVKSSGEKGLSTEWNDDHEQTGNHDCEQHQHLNHVIENRTDFPAGPVEGQIIFRTDLHALYIYNGTTWIPYEPAIKKGIHYLSIPGTSFKGDTQGDQPSEDYHYAFGKLVADENDCVFHAPVSLPAGATVISAEVIGNISDEQWALERIRFFNGTNQPMASANFNTEDFTISNAAVDNLNYAYFLYTSALDNTDEIWGAKILYYF